MMMNNGELVEMWGVDVGDFVGCFHNHLFSCLWCDCCILLIELD